MQNIQETPKTASDVLDVVMLGPSLNVNGGITSVERLILEQSGDSFLIRHIPTHEEGHLAGKLSVFSRAVVSFVSLIIKGNVDLVHIHVSQRGSVLRKSVLVVLAKFFKKPVFLHTHGSEFKQFYTNSPLILRFLIGKVFQMCDGLIVLSESWSEFYSDNLGLEKKKIAILPNPVKLPAQVPERTGSKPVNLLFLGRLGYRKGAFDLIHAFSQLSTDIRNSSLLTLAGDGQVEEVCNLAEKLGVANSVRLPGWVNESERDNLLQNADIFILPSYNEGLPMAMLEAMGWRLPVIVTPVGGIPELITDGYNGLITEPGDIGQLSSKMSSVVTDEVLRHFLGNNARTTVSGFSIEKYSTNLLDVYSSVR